MESVEVEACGDPEVAAPTAPAGPVEVGVRLVVDIGDGSVGEDELFNVRLLFLVAGYMIEHD